MKNHPLILLDHPSFVISTFKSQVAVFMEKHFSPLSLFALFPFYFPKTMSLAFCLTIIFFPSSLLHAHANNQHCWNTAHERVHFHQ